MYKVAFTMRDSDSYACEEERHEFYFATEKDANAFYDDLENFVIERTGGYFHMDQKFKPEKMNDIVLYGYDPSIHRLYRVD